MLCSLLEMTKQMDRHMSAVIVDVILFQNYHVV